MKPDQGTETRNVHYPLIYPAIYLLSFSKYKTRGPRYAYEKQRKTEREMWVGVSGFFFIFCGEKMEYPGPERDAQFKSKTQSEKNFSLLSHFLRVWLKVLKKR